MDTNDLLDFDEDDTLSDSSFPATFASYFSSQISNSLQENFNKIGKTWLDIGIPAAKRDEKIDLLRNVIMDSVAHFQDTETNELKKQLNYREHQLNEINKILKALSLDPYVVDSSRTLLVQNKMLALKYKEMLHVKTERMEQLERIASKLKKICHSLGTSYQEPIFATNIPSERELMEFRSLAMNQEQLLDDRKKRYESIKSLVANFQSELEYTPVDSRERMLFSPSNDFIYSQDNIVLMTDFHKKIVQVYNKAKTEVENLKSVIIKLFARLDIEESIQKSFLQSLSGTLPRIKHLLQSEIEKYELLKKSCMEKIIKSIRRDLNRLCKSCKVETFDESILVSENYSEELLVLHENELAKLNKFNEHYSGVFEKLDQWEDSLDKLLELEKKLLDPNRFNNRGGSLLQNERDKRILSKRLPKLENEVKALVTVIESKEKLPFNLYGLQIDDYFEFNWKHFNELKDGAKNVAFKKSGSDALKTSTLSGGSSQKKFRYPLQNSPRVNRKVANPMASRQLQFTPKSFELVENEMEFQRCLMQGRVNQDPLQSTFAEENFDKISSTSQSKLARTPNSAKLPMKNTRRLSKSCDDLTKLVKVNKGIPYGVTRRDKRPPFLP